MANEIGPGTKLNVATLIAVVGAAVWIDRRISIAETSAINSQAVMAVETKAEFDKINLRLRSIEITAESAGDDRWKRSDMRAYIREAQAMNPTIPFPKVD